MKAFVFLACLVVYANAHACFIFPQQRGDISSSILTEAGKMYMYSTVTNCIKVMLIVYVLITLHVEMKTKMGLLKLHTCKPLLPK